MSIEIHQVDPADERAVRDFYDVYLTCGRHDSASFIAAPFDELSQVIRQPTWNFRYTAFLARDGGTVVGEGWYAAFARASRDKVIVTPRVLPQYRRRGVGGAVLARLEEQARADGRTVLRSEPRWAMEYGPDGAGSAGVEFARRHGYPVLLVEAGYTDIVAGAGPEPAAQWGTLVRRAHRGHGLGYGLKAAVIGLLQRERPDITATVTSNTLTNAAMVTVNDQLGYQVVEYAGEVEKRLETRR